MVDLAQCQEGQASLKYLLLELLFPVRKDCCILSAPEAPHRAPSNSYEAYIQKECINILDQPFTHSLEHLV